MKKSERKGRRSFDTAIEYETVAMVAREKTRTTKAAVRATRHPLPSAVQFVLSRPAQAVASPFEGRNTIGERRQMSERAQRRH
jgi:hypothetical protein